MFAPQLACSYLATSAFIQTPGDWNAVKGNVRDKVKQGSKLRIPRERPIERERKWWDETAMKGILIKISISDPLHDAAPIKTIQVLESPFGFLKMMDQFVTPAFSHV